MQLIAAQSNATGNFRLFPRKKNRVSCSCKLPSQYRLDLEFRRKKKIRGACPLLSSRQQEDLVGCVVALSYLYAMAVLGGLSEMPGGLFIVFEKLSLVVGVCQNKKSLSSLTQQLPVNALD
jgi:hypothetical protein